MRAIQPDMETAQPVSSANSATSPEFMTACDQLSAAVDAVQFERLRWARTEAPMLARLVELAHGAVEDRDDIELFDEGSGGAIRRWVVKVHGNRIFALVISLTGTTVSVQAEAIPRSPYKVASAEPLQAEFKKFDAALMAAALGTLFARVTA
jgi:hypothetical protein